MFQRFHHLLRENNISVFWFYFITIIVLLVFLWDSSKTNTRSWAVTYRWVNQTGTENSWVDKITEPKKSEERQTEQKIYTTGISKNSSRFINGLAPVDIYLSMEERGFKTNKSFSTDGNFWTSTYTYAGIDYRVDTWSTNIDNVESIRGTVTLDVTKKKIIAAQEFFTFLSTLPYQNADPKKSYQWVIDNYNNDKATTTIGDVKFTIYAPTITYRSLMIEKAR